MSQRWQVIRISLICALVLGFVRCASAGNISGTIEEVDTDAKTVKVKLAGKKDESKTVAFTATTVFMIDGKKGKLEDITEGMHASILTNASDVATRFTLKGGKSTPSRKQKKDDGESAAEGSWPQYHGPRRDNISTETGLLDEWPNGGPKVAWEKSGLGDGYSSIAISEGKVFTMGNQQEGEMLLCMDGKGKPIWAAKLSNSIFRDGQGNGPRGTPTVDADRVYALGANGDLVCAGVDNGEIVWQKNILNEYGGRNIQWGISESVLIDGNNVICYPGGQDATVVAINKLTGQGVWRARFDGAPKASYASPILIEHGGERMIVNFAHTGVFAIRAKTGDVLWGFEASANNTANCSSPLYSDGMIFTASGYGTGCAMFKLGTNGKANVAYTNKSMKNHHGGMVLSDNHVYGFDEGVLRCLDLKTGKSVWENRSVGKGAVTCADGHLYLRSEDGPVALCELTTSGYKEKGRFEPRNRSQNRAWSHPVVCGGRLYLRDMDTLTVYDIKK